MYLNKERKSLATSQNPFEIRIALETFHASTLVRFRTLLLYTTSELPLSLKLATSTTETRGRH